MRRIVRKTVDNLAVAKGGRKVAEFARKPVAIIIARLNPGHQLSWQPALRRAHQLSDVQESR
jgi:hypothetical protein